MATETYAIIVDGEQVATMTADFTEASSPLRLDGYHTPFQTADARHRPLEAAEKLLLWCHSQGGPLCDVIFDEDGLPELDYGTIKVEEIDP